MIQTRFALSRDLSSVASSLSTESSGRCSASNAVELGLGGGVAGVLERLALEAVGLGPGATSSRTAPARSAAQTAKAWSSSVVGSITAPSLSTRDVVVSGSHGTTGTGNEIDDPSHLLHAPVHRDGLELGPRAELGTQRLDVTAHGRVGHADGLGDLGDPESGRRSRHLDLARRERLECARSCAPRQAAPSRGCRRLRRLSASIETRRRRTRGRSPPGRPMQVVDGDDVDRVPAAGVPKPRASGSGGHDRRPPLPATNAGEVLDRPPAVEAVEDRHEAVHELVGARRPAAVAAGLARRTIASS